MKQLNSVQSTDVQDIYSGPVCDLWELLMGQQIHIGGLQSSTQLAEAAGIAAGSRGVDLCCCRGAGMRFLLQFRQVAAMTGVDVTSKVIAVGAERFQKAGLADRTTFVVADATKTGLSADQFDFVWGEDAWCYVPDKPALIAEAARIVKPGGIIAFTDWLEGPTPLSDAEAARFMDFMKFPSLATLNDYSELLTANRCQVRQAINTGRYATCVDLYHQMLTHSFGFDALQLLGGDHAMFEAVLGEMAFAGQLAREGKLIQGLFVAERIG